MNKYASKDAKWIIKDYSVDAVEQIKEQLGVSALTAKLLNNRGCINGNQALDFLNKDISGFCDPYLLKDMRAAVNKVLEHLENKSKIMIYGDYDVDGVTSTVILYLYLKTLGADVYYFIPERINDGYGLNSNSIDRFIKDDIKLIITVDSGITANQEIDYAAEGGIDVIVTDHHTCLPELPRACAIINPKRPDCNYPFKELAGVGVVYKFLCALDSKYFKVNIQIATEKIFNLFADFIAIGTIADVMPIRGENRIIVSTGLDKLAKTTNIGLIALLDEINNESNSYKKKSVTSALVGFVIAPRINAAGRMTSAMRAVELFLTHDPNTAHMLAAELCAVNKQRQIHENEIFLEAVDMIKQSFDFENDLFIILDADKWHHGVIGIVASRICEKYHLPCIMISFIGEGREKDGSIGKGSGRSIKGINLFDALSSCKDILEKFGGHELAAGLSVKRENLPELKRRLNEYARQHINQSLLGEKLYIDAEITKNDISIKTATELAVLEPYGLSNPVPLFCLIDFTITDIISIGEGRHTKLTLKKDDSYFTALYFGMSYTQFPYCVGDRVDVACNMDINTFLNKRTVQLTVRSIRQNIAQTEPVRRRLYIYEMFKQGKNVFFASENTPTREDFKTVFVMLRKKAQQKNMIYTELPYYEEDSDYIPVDISYFSRLYYSTAKVKFSVLKVLFVFDILNELGVIETEKTDDELIIKFKIIGWDAKRKVNLDSSSIMKRLKAFSH